MKIFTIKYEETGCWIPGREEEKRRYARIIANDITEAINTVFDICNKSKDKIKVTKIMYEGESLMNKRMILDSDVFSCPLYYEEHMDKIRRRKSRLEKMQNDDNIDGDADSHNWGSSGPSVIW